MYGTRKGAHRFLANKSERKNPLIVHRSGWKKNITMNFQKDGL
jgi:hypothetical protein